MRRSIDTLLLAAVDVVAGPGAAAARDDELVRGSLPLDSAPLVSECAPRQCVTRLPPSAWSVFLHCYAGDVPPRKRRLYQLDLLQRHPQRAAHNILDLLHCTRCYSEM